MLEVESLAVDYGTAQVLHDVSLKVEPGTVVALLGNNGAGKTTLLRALSGILRRQGGRVRSGRAQFDGLDLLPVGPDRIVRRGLVQVPEGRRIFGQLTVEENLLAGALSVSSRRRIHARRDQIEALFPVLERRRKQRAGLLSGGEQQMLAIGRAMMSEPKAIIMDEPSLGIAPLIAREIMTTISEISATGTSVLLVEQNTKLALDVAHYGYVMDTGRIVAQGTPAELEAGDILLEVTLGRNAAHQLPPMEPVL